MDSSVLYRKCGLTCICSMLSSVSRFSSLSFSLRSSSSAIDRLMLFTVRPTLAISSSPSSMDGSTSPKALSAARWPMWSTSLSVERVRKREMITETTANSTVLPASSMTNAPRPYAEPSPTGVLFSKWTMLAPGIESAMLSLAYDDESSMSASGSEGQMKAPSSPTMYRPSTRASSNSGSKTPMSTSAYT